MQRCIGVEGPSLSGKTTTVTEVCRRNGFAHVLCYADFARDRDITLPPVYPMTWREECDALAIFRALDGLRREATTDATVAVLDRTPLSLLAHLNALRCLGGFEVDDDDVARLHQSFVELIPARVIYFDATASVQGSRAPQREPLPYPLLDREFNVQFRAYFEHVVDEDVEIWWLDASQSVDQLATIVGDLILGNG